MPKRKARPVTVSAPQKGRSKSKGGIALGELFAALASGRAVRAPEKTLAWAQAAAIMLYATTRLEVDMASSRTTDHGALPPLSLHVAVGVVSRDG